MVRKVSATIRSAEITPREIYMNRRQFVGFTAGSLALGSLLPLALRAQAAPAATKLTAVRNAKFDPGEAPTAVDKITTYNNFYEFGTDKEDPAHNASGFKARPWQLEIAGEVEQPGVLDLDELLKPHPLEERIYRLRCVEAWSMVVPWIGIPLADVIKRYRPTSKAKYVEFTSVMRPQEMPGQQRPILDWPYREGLRIDEAMHPLSLLAVGLYGEVLPNQNGAPLRLVVPWKYGFKSIKSIVRLRFTETQPATTWNKLAQEEYGFYANVNPEVDHPRWSQRKERRLGEFFRRDTLPFNGYAEQVASLYAGMDLQKNF